MCLEGKIGSLLAAALALGIARAAPPQSPRPAASRPNLLLCVADDWGYGNAGAYGDRAVETPAFDRIAREGALFTHAFTAAPSCTPSRAAILTGQMSHRLREGGTLHGFLPKEFETYVDRLEAAGYRVGHTRKGWGPGNFEAGGRTRNPAGPRFESFEAFLETVPEGTPFAFWFGSNSPHRPYDKTPRGRQGLRPAAIGVPPHLPDVPAVRADLLDYYNEVRRFDEEVGSLLQALERRRALDGTLVVVTSDNGAPFPRAKANVYDAGTREPLVMRWPGRIEAGRTVPDLVSLTDLAPTFLEAAGLAPLPDATGRSLLPLVSARGASASRVEPRREVFLERERHAYVREGNLGYPVRAIRTPEFLYLRNLRPSRWPAGDPELRFSVGPYGDCDNSPSKDFILEHRADPRYARFYTLAFDRRPEEELYDLRKDPGQLRNVAGEPGYAAHKRRLRERLDRWMSETADPRARSDADPWDRYPYFGAPASK
jgi:arylsulfatase A-like enzyme